MNKELNQIYEVFTSILNRIIKEQQANQNNNSHIRRKGNKTKEEYKWRKIKL